MNQSLPLLIALLCITQYATASDGIPLADAVRNFNRKAIRDATGKDQPPLTEAEVLAAINGWRLRYSTSVDDTTLTRFYRICDTGRLPPGYKLTFVTNTTGYRDFDFDVWWIDLCLPDGHYPQYTIHIRQRWISSRKLTASEIATRRRNAELESHRGFDPTR